MFKKLINLSKLIFRPRTKVKALFADIYRVRKYKKEWRVYLTHKGVALNTGLVYRYWLRGDEKFHPTVLSVTDIKGEVSVERLTKKCLKAS